MRDIMNYHFPTRHDTQTMRGISRRFEGTDCISEVSWYVHWIEVNGNRDKLVWIPEGNRPETRRDTYQWEIIRTWDLRISDTIEPARRRVNDQVNWSQSQQIHHTRTRRLSIVASLIFDMLPSNWLNWQFQRRFHSPYATESRVTGNAEAVDSPEWVYKLCAIHVDPYHRRQLTLRLQSIRLDWVSYVTEAAKSVNGYIPRHKCT